MKRSVTIPLFALATIFAIGIATGISIAYPLLTGPAGQVLDSSSKLSSPLAASLPAGASAARADIGPDLQTGALSATTATTDPTPRHFDELSQLDQQWYLSLDLDQQDLPFANKLSLIEFARSSEQALYDGVEAAQLVPAAIPLGSDCTTKDQVDAASGELRSYEDCVPYYDESAHPYFSYATDSLLAMSEGDAIANYVLGGRAGDLDLKFTYMMRAAALSGKPGPLGDVFNHVGGPVDERGRPRKEETAKRYVLNRLGYSMGFRNMDPSGMAADMNNRFSAEEMSQLNQRVENLQVQMNRLRLDRGMTPLPFNQDTE